MRQLLKEAIAWFLLPVLFLTYYCGRHSGPASAIVPHLYIFLVWWLVLMGTRLLCIKLLPGKVAAIMGDAISGFALLVVLGYYCLVIIGLESWGRVITQELIDTYAMQITHLADVKGISLELAVGVIVLVVALIMVGVNRLLRSHDGLSEVARQRMSPLLLVPVAASLIGLVHLGVSYIRNADVDGKEPVSLTFSVNRLQTDVLSGHRVDTVALEREDKLEDAARKAYQPTTRPTTNIILVVVDALRPDHMGIFGYGRDTTPYLKQKESEGRLSKVSTMRGVCAESWCGLVGLMSSKFVHQFPTRPISLQEVLKKAGYSTHFVLGGDHVNFYGLSKFYGDVDSYFDGSMATGRYINDDLLVLDQLRVTQFSKDRPKFIQFHLMSSHELGKRLPEYAKFSPTKPYSSTTTGPPRDETTNFYDNGVLQADGMISRIMDILDQKGLLDDALLVVTGDHGEGLGERGQFAHGKRVWEHLIRVPFVMVGFGKRSAPPLGSPMISSHVDLAPTILHEIELPLPPTWVGQPLQKPMTRRITHFEQRPGSFGLYDWLPGERLTKYVLLTDNYTETAFDMRTDPVEQRDILGQIPFPLLREYRMLVQPGR